MSTGRVVVLSHMILSGRNVKSDAAAISFLALAPGTEIPIFELIPALRPPTESMNLSMALLIPVIRMLLSEGMGIVLPSRSDLNPTATITSPS